MHRSLLRQVLIDVHRDDYPAAVAFWSAALGGRVEPEPDNPEYVSLRDHLAAVEVMIQDIGDTPSRVHLDFESDDVEAEVRRLEALGATRVQQVRSWWVLRDPAGLLFCVLRPQSEDFAERARVWA
jgi:predicted enzyme related to lactoylglutathione lyase